MLLELGQRMATAGRRRYAWAILSPLVTAVYSDATLKATVMALRKEFEKPDLPSLVTRETHRRVLPAPLSPALLDVLEAIDRQVAAPLRSNESLGHARATRLDQKTGMGKTFLAIAERLGLEHAHLTRIDELPEPFRLMSDDHLHVVVRSELLVSMSPGEIPALFALALEQGRPGLRLLTQGSLEERQRWTSALLAAAGLISVIDGDVFAAHCDTTARFAEVCAKLKEIDQVLERTPNDYLVQSALFTVRSKLFDHLIKGAREFGLTPAARSAIKAPEQTQLPLDGWADV